MSPHKSRKEKRKTHKHKGYKHKSRSRLHLRKYHVRRKSEGPSDNNPQVTGNLGTDTRDMSSFIDNRREMVKQLFSSVGEDFLTRNLPLIMKETTREELKRICFEELSTMSADFVYKVLEGIQCDTRPHSSPEDWPSRKETEPICSTSFCEATPKPISGEKCSTIGKENAVIELALKRREDGNASNEASATELLESSSSEANESGSEVDDSDGCPEGITFAHDELPSTSYQPLKTKKLAKVAPFIIKAPKVEINQPEGSVDESIAVSEIDCESVGDNEEEDVGDQLYDSDSLAEESMSEEDHDAGAVYERQDNQRTFEEEISQQDTQRRLAEVEELEHRARAIKSMLANIDRYQTVPDKSSSSSGGVRFSNLE